MNKKDFEDMYSVLYEMNKHIGSILGYQLVYFICFTIIIILLIIREC